MERVENDKVEFGRRPIQVVERVAQVVGGGAGQADGGDVRRRRRIGLEPDGPAAGVRLGVGEDLEVGHPAKVVLELAVEAGYVAAGLERRIRGIAAARLPLLDWSAASSAVRSRGPAQAYRS